ncbi:protein of unknown function [Candidatus Promineifilum breve]|uniref:Uncharacterized protein n=1 Tax=Candidatus Promineifilum breve TaxID=1806508 RepID=A0A160T0Q0_9CHLR|nr:protein of unknown function [Candidatus Promineifilum breve]
MVSGNADHTIVTNFPILTLVNVFFYDELGREGTSDADDGARYLHGHFVGRNGLRPRFSSLNLQGLLPTDHRAGMHERPGGGQDRGG